MSTEDTRPFSKEFLDTSSPDGTFQCLGDFLRFSKLIYGDDTNKIAIKDGNTGEELNFSQYDDNVNKVANALLEIGFKRGDRMLVSGKNTLLYCFVCWACWKIGIIFIPARLGSTVEDYLFYYNDWCNNVNNCNIIICVVTKFSFSLAFRYRFKLYKRIHRNNSCHADANIFSGDRYI